MLRGGYVTVDLTSTPFMLDSGTEISQPITDIESVSTIRYALEKSKPLLLKMRGIDESENEHHWCEWVTSDTIDTNPLPDSFNIPSVKYGGNGVLRVTKTTIFFTMGG